MFLEAYVAGLVALVAGVATVMGVLYCRRSGDVAPLILVPSLLFTAILYTITAWVEYEMAWTEDIRLFYRINALLLVIAILTTFVVRIIQRRNGL